MIIAGLQKMTLLDFPGKVACTVFLPGCNFRCPFCHNSGLLDQNVPEEISQDTLLTFLKKRTGLLDGVCITGGEPTLQQDLDQLLQSIKALGYAVKLDTNGTRPEMLKKLVAEGLVDYVAMDIKNSPAQYGETIGVPRIHLDAIEESIRFLLSGTVDYEFRTTVVDEFHDTASMEAMGQWLKLLNPDIKAKRFFLQPFTDRDSVLVSGLHTPKKEKCLELAEILRPYVRTVEIRALEE